eukprot:3516652-Pleurochrysis_carterae.AAC.2
MTGCASSEHSDRMRLTSYLHNEQPRSTVTGGAWAHVVRRPTRDPDEQPTSAPRKVLHDTCAQESHTFASKASEARYLLFIRTATGDYAN